MTRDMDLIREILLTIEESNKLPFHRDSKTNLYKKFGEQYGGQQIRYHLWLMKEKGLVHYSKTGYVYEAEVRDSGLVEEVEEEAISSLTWDGHEFLDMARDQSTWNQAKKTISEKGGSLTFDVLKGVLTQLARQTVGL